MRVEAGPGVMHAKIQTAMRSQQGSPSVRVASESSGRFEENAALHGERCM